MAARRQMLTNEQIAELPTHPYLQFSNEADERLRQRYLATLYRLKDRDIHIPYSLDWQVAEDTGLAAAMNPYLTFLYQDAQGVSRITCSAWRNLFQLQEPIYRELTLEFFSTVQFDPTERDCNVHCFTFRLGGARHEISIRELAWRLGLYTQAQTRSTHFVQFLNSLIIQVPEDYSESDFWGEVAGVPYVPSAAKERMLHSPIHRLLHRLMASTLTHKAGSDKVPTTDLFYLWTLVTPGRHLNLPYAIALFLSRKGAGGRAGSGITGGHFVTRLAASYSLTTRDRLRGMVALPIRTLGTLQLESMSILERMMDGTYQIPHAVQPDDVMDDPVPQPQPQPHPQPRRRRVRSPAQQQGPEREIDIRYLAERVEGLQVQTQWIGSTLIQICEHQNIQPQYPFPPPYPPFPSWYTPYQGPYDGAGTSGAHHDDDDEDDEDE